MFNIKKYLWSGLRKNESLSFVCLLFPFYSYAAKISLSISGKIEDHSAMLYFPDGENFLFQ